MRAFVRYYLKYTPGVLGKMNITQLSEAFQDLMFIRSQRSKYEAEE